MVWAKAKEALGLLSTTTVSDALDKLGITGYLSWEFKPLFPCKMIGIATTLQRIPRPSNYDPTEFASHGLAIQEVIDSAPEGSVVIISSQGAGDNFSTWGGLMTTRAHLRGLAGAVLDGGIRDSKEIASMGFPVFSRTIVPSSAVGRLITVAVDVPVTVGGVLIHPGDIIVGDDDGVVVIPKAKLEEVVSLAQQIETVEEEMTAFLKDGNSLTEAVKTFRQR